MIDYINYFELENFYTIQEACKQLGMEKLDLKAKCEQWNISPVRGESGAYGFYKYTFRSLHNKLYHEDHQEKGSVDPWA